MLILFELYITSIAVIVPNGVFLDMIRVQHGAIAVEYEPLCTDPPPYKPSEFLANPDS